MFNNKELIMGFFSWKTQDTHESIMNEFTATPTVNFWFVFIDKNGERQDVLVPSYNGYGEFAGFDFHEVLANMNGLNGRDNGISIEVGTMPTKLVGKTIMWPQLFQECQLGKKVDFTKEMESCPYQGYFFCNDDEDENDDENEW